MSDRLPAEVVSDLSSLPRLSEIGRRPRIGDLVVIRSRGQFRLAVVTKVGRVNVQTAYTTESALAEAARYGTKPTVTRKPVAIDDPFIRFYPTQGGQS